MAWQIISLCRDTTATDPPPMFRATVANLENPGALPTHNFGEEPAVRDFLRDLHIPEAEIDAAFANPPNCHSAIKKPGKRPPSRKGGR